MSNRLQSIAEIIFALAFIAILSLIASGVFRFGGNVNEQIARTNAATELRELRAFDETTVTGETVLSAIRNHNSLYDYDLEINVVDGGSANYGAGGVPYVHGSSSPSISPASAYTAVLDKNSNGVVTGITFTKAP